MLSAGLIGYSVVNPGPVGGSRSPGDEFNRELYIRWLQVSIFMPVLQLNAPPGGETNDLEIIKLNKRLIKIRAELIVPALMHGLQETRLTGVTIIRPLFFVDPRASPDIRDQFAITDQIVVAPILNEGQRSRDLYLPSGWWRDEITSGHVMGGKWIRNYSVPLERVAFFTRIEEPS